MASSTRGTTRREPAVTKPTEEILLNDSKELDARRIACHVREIIKIIGEDPNREGLRKTPERFEKALKYLTSGYRLNLDHVLNGATFSVSYDEMVIVKDIEFFSLCEHHLLPFFGKAHVAYLPDKRVLGLDRKSTRLNSSHDQISYAVFCLKKKKKNQRRCFLQCKTS